MFYNCDVNHVCKAALCHIRALYAISTGESQSTMQRLRRPRWCHLGLSTVCNSIVTLRHFFIQPQQAPACAECLNTHCGRKDTNTPLQCQLNCIGFMSANLRSASRNLLDFPRMRTAGFDQRTLRI